MPWTVALSKEAVKQLSELPLKHQGTVRKDLLEMAVDPFRGLVKALQGKDYKGIYRKISGQYSALLYSSLAPSGDALKGRYHDGVIVSFQWFAGIFNRLLVRSTTARIGCYNSTPRVSLAEMTVLGGDGSQTDGLAFRRDDLARGIPQEKLSLDVLILVYNLAQVSMPNSKTRPHD